MNTSSVHTEYQTGQGTSSPRPTPACSRQVDIVGTRIWLDEFNLLEVLYNDVGNCSPKLRYPDLISACVSVVFEDADPAVRIFGFLHTQLVLRDQETARRQESMWRMQYRQLLALQKSELNRHPHPQFKLDHFTTGCVALAMQASNAKARIFDHARRNIALRAAAHY
ncbi:hypothetical protein [Pseudoduganella violacea]|uniref:Uncharacterized protein n=1 Tax=Pseudoduganella violacea TaxID=1715466 RepID=A0A7W5FXE6_9BURK|nr:hypothetical protein [Pseudoduganella violacea]MBB3122183.1 hypothetical protein [Pseudoduganella violacea]